MKHLLIFLFATLLTGGFVGKVRAEATEPAIVITVTDQGGAPLPFATITVTEAHGMLTSHLQANAQGMLTLTGPFNTNVAPYVICASVADSHNTYSSCTYNVMPPAADALNISLLVTLPAGVAVTSTSSPAAGQGWISGSITLASTHAPLPGVTVLLASTPLHTVTGPDGRYQFPALSTTSGANGGPTYTVTLSPPPGMVIAGPTSQSVTVIPNHGAEADFTLTPAFSPFWVENFIPQATLWSGPDAHALPFGARPQWSSFLVVAPQQGSRLFVYDPLTHNYAWINAAQVGPSGPPPA